MQTAFEKVPLWGKYSNGSFAIIDAGTNLGKYRWYVSKIGYVYRRDYDTRNGHVYLHHEILSAPKGMWRDHINGDKLDNRRCNLRLLTPRQSAFNRGGRLAKSGYKGVRVNGSRFSAQITNCCKNIYLGSYENPIEAARAYDRAAIKINGPLAKLNNV